MKNVDILDSLMYSAFYYLKGKREPLLEGWMSDEWISL